MALSTCRRRPSKCAAGENFLGRQRNLHDFCTISELRHDTPRPSDIGRKRAAAFVAAAVAAAVAAVAAAAAAAAAAAVAARWLLWLLMRCPSSTTWTRQNTRTSESGRRPRTDRRTPERAAPHARGTCPGTCEVVTAHGSA